MISLLRIVCRGILAVPVRDNLALLLWRYPKAFSARCSINIASKFWGNGKAKSSKFSLNIHSENASYKLFFPCLMMCLGSAISGCCFQTLTVQTQTITHEELASYHVGTPDPRLDYPPIGERLLIQWSLSACDFEGHDLILDLKVRFHNRQEQEIQIPIENKRGYYLYKVVNEDYCETGGILTYLAEIREGDCVIATWKHPLWVPLLTLHDNPRTD